MSYHDAQRTRFLQLSQVAEAPTILDNAARYEVRLEPASVSTDSTFWRVAGVYHLSPDENRGKHAIYVDVVDESGQRLRDPNMRLLWGWEGQQSGQRSDPKPFDKPDNEPATNVDLYLGQKTWVQVEGGGLTSDRVANMHSNHPDEKGPNGDLWNTVGHHSFYVVFQRARKQSATVGVSSTQNGHTSTSGTGGAGGTSGTNGASGSNGGRPVVTPPPTDRPVVDRPVVTVGSSFVVDKLGIDANAPVDEGSGNISPQVLDPTIISATGVGWVRLNFIARGRWQSPTDPNWQQTYRKIIDGFRSQNLRIYGLISAQAMPDDPNDFRNGISGGAPSHNWIDRYAENFATIANLFHQDVDVFEAINEPDDWHGGNSNWIHPDWFAVMMQKVHDRVRGDSAIRHIKIVSGPLQGLHNNGNGGVNYLRSTYAAGKRLYSWGENGKPFPFDGVGYHLYIAQDQNSSTDTIRQDYKLFMDQVRAVIVQEEGQLKPIYLSEYGWFSNNGKEDFQVRAMQAGLEEALNDSSLALVIWFSTQDFYGDGDGHYFGVYRKGALSADNRKPCFQMLNSIATSGRKVIISGATQREATPPPAKPQPVDATQPQPEAAKPPTTPQWAGRVNAASGLNLREGPGQGHASLGMLVDGSSLTVISETNGWLLVETSLGVGYVSAQYIMRADQAGSHMTAGERLLLDTWTRYRELIDQESARLRIDPGVVVSTLLAESGGDAFRDGRMVIRFENHIFFGEWGKNNPDRFNQHFIYDPNTTWQGHQWRPDANQPFRACHSNQNEEWATFDFARQLDEAAAIRSISMGAPQIMGFNHASIGYASPRAMFDTFQSSAEAQIRGMFRFIESKNAVGALQSGDYFTFAKIYNGSGQAAFYESLIRANLDNFHRVVGTQRGSTPRGTTQSGTAGTPRGWQPTQPAPEAVATPPVAVERTPQPAPDRELAEADPELYAAWRKHIEQGFANNQTMFDEVLRAFLNPYWTTVLMYKVLFGVGIVALIAAATLAVLLKDNPVTAIGTTAIFGGVGIAAFVAYFVSRPLQALEENLQFITWLGVIYNSYWTQLAQIRKQSSAKKEVDEVTTNTVARLKELLDKHSELSGKRPVIK